MLHYSINTHEQDVSTINPKNFQKEKRMKKIWQSLYCFFESLGRARAASSLARQGNYKLAQEIMSEKSKCC